MNFKIGQRVKCVDDHFNNRKPVHAVKAGEVYTVIGFYQCPSPSCNSKQLNLKEFPYKTMMGCRCPHTSYMRQTFFAFRFIPAKDSENDAEITKEVLKSS